MSDIAQFRTTRPHMLKASKEYASQTLMGGLSGFESPIGLDRRDRIHALKSGDIGFVHSWDINTSVDGPGTRMTVFMSGCPLRCQYCQNPDTWKMRDGQPVYLDAMIKKVDRYKDLFKATHGGITFSGGESMMQPAFVSRVFHAAKEMGVHTCLDTSGFLNTNYTDEMIDDIDLCLLDVKSGDEETYHKVTGGAAAAHHRLRTAAGEGRQEDLGAVRARAGVDRLGGEHRERGQDLRELRRGRRTHRRAGIPPARAPEVA
ncbi:pyruvate formate-lyase activating enzyme [Bifidobacterium bifidum]|nr:pyruvate formate-lyase activating enzyme [Bifidobacterium bifidum]